MMSFIYIVRGMTIFKLNPRLQLKTVKLILQCVCGCVWEREREREWASVRAWERVSELVSEWVCVCVCVCEREREWVSERVCVY